MSSPDQPNSAQTLARPADTPAASCVGGLHEVCVGVTDLQIAQADLLPMVADLVSAVNSMRVQHARFTASTPRCARCVCCISKPITDSFA